LKSIPLFLEAVGKHGRDWEAIAQKLGGGKTAGQMSSYYYHLRMRVKVDPSILDKYDLKVLYENDIKRWTTEEHSRFVEAIRKHGLQNLNDITRAIGTRKNDEVRKHLKRFFKKVKADPTIEGGDLIESIAGYFNKDNRRGQLRVAAYKRKSTGEEKVVDAKPNEKWR